MVSNEQPPKSGNGNKRLGPAQVLTIVATVAAITMGGVTIWQTATNRALESEMKRVDRVELSIGTLVATVNDFKQTVMSQMSAQGEKLSGLEKRFDNHERRENRR